MEGRVFYVSMFAKNRQFVHVWTFFTGYHRHRWGHCNYGVDLDFSLLAQRGVCTVFGVDLNFGLCVRGKKTGCVFIHHGELIAG